MWITQNKRYSSRKPEELQEKEIRTKILSASLTYVAELGWSRECLVKGSEAAGYPGISHGMFTLGAGDLVHYFNTSCNSNLVEILKQVG